MIRNHFHRTRFWNWTAGMRNRTVGIGLLALVMVVAEPSLGIGTPQPVKLGACHGSASSNRLVFQPRHIQVNCGAGRSGRYPPGPVFTAVNDISWSSWTQHRAFGIGTAHIVRCHGFRNCRSRPTAHLRADRPQKCRNGAYAFTSLRIRLDLPKPRGRRRFPRTWHFWRVCDST